MNALRPTFLRTVAQTARHSSRSKATLVAGKPSAVPPIQKYNFKKEWLSDPSTYPIMGIMSCAIVFLVGMSANAVFGYKDVQFDPRKRNSTLQTWGQEERKSVMERFNRATRGGVNPEGLGINHEEWIKSKAQK